jgi:transposase
MAHGYRSWSPHQCALLPQNPLDWLPKDHIAPILLDVLEAFDLQTLRCRSWETRGAAGFDPAMMVVLVLYYMLNSQMSARSMERFLMSDLGGRFLCGDCDVPGCRCIAAFRQQHRDHLAGLFAQSVQCCIKANLVDSSLSLVMAASSRRRQTNRAT